MQRASLCRLGATLILCLSTLCLGIEFTEGTGSTEDPYLISTAEQLLAIGEDRSASYVLTGDIDLSSHPLLWFQQYSVADTDYFQGSLDGQGYEISNLPIPLFNELGPTAQITRITLSNAYIVTDTNDCCGILARINHGRIAHCHVSGEIIHGDLCGGLVGHNLGRILDCHTQCTLLSDDIAGGLVGQNEGQIDSCSAENQGFGVFGRSYVGGLVGFNGSNWDYNDMTIQACYTTGSISGGRTNGGLIGYHQDGEVSNCYTDCELYRQWYYWAGALIGTYEDGNIRNCYTRKVPIGYDPNHYLDPLFGGHWINNTWTCYYPGDPNLIPTNDYRYNPIPLSSIDIQDPNCFLTWDFYGNKNDGIEDTWYMPAQSMPVLTWQQEYSGLIATPSVQGMTLDQAIEEIQTAGLTVGEIQYDYSKTIDFNNVICCRNKKWLEPNSPVHLTLSQSYCPGLQGSGTTQDPYQISSPGELEYAGFAFDLWQENLYLSLVQDINMIGRTYHESLIAPELYPGPTSSPLGGFNGHFNGQGFKIQNLYLKSTSMDEYEYSSILGLFGIVGSNGVIENLLLDICILNHHVEYTGGITGINNGIIRQCESTSSITQTVEDGSVGGIIGWNQGRIDRCFSQVSLSGSSDYIGGLIGVNDEIIDNCYTVGHIQIFNSNYGKGTLTGRNKGYIYQSYSTATTKYYQFYPREITIPEFHLICGTRYRIPASGDCFNSYFLASELPETWNTPDLGIPMTDAMMKDANNYHRWSFHGDDTDDVTDEWFMPADGYPILTWQTGLTEVPDVSGMTIDDANAILQTKGLRLGKCQLDWHPDVNVGAIICIQVPAYVDVNSTIDVVVSQGTYDWTSNPGLGTEASPYQLETAGQLIAIGKDPNLWKKNYVMTNDISFIGWHGLSYVIPSQGFYPGGGRGPYTLKEGFSGVFDGQGHHIQHLRFEVDEDGITQQDSDRVGFFQDIESNGIVTNLMLQSPVALLKEDVEQLGLLATSNAGTISQCIVSQASIDIEDPDGNYFGGMVGVNTGSIHNCRSTGRVQLPASNELAIIAGLVGGNEGHIVHCYSAYKSPLNDANLVSIDDGGMVTSSYYLTSTETLSPGAEYGIALTDLQMQNQANYSGWDFVGETVNGTEDIWFISDKGYPLLWWEDLK